MKKNNRQKNKHKRTDKPKIQDQFKLLRKDVLKLRHDLEQGYDMLRNLFEAGLSHSGSFKSKTKPN